jgi:filamentous hemagglutinin family protein
MKTYCPVLPKITATIFLFQFILMNSTVAQVVPDGFGSTRVTSSDGRNFVIEDGDRAGNNLFHSFQEFSVPTGGSAYFNNTSNVQNIFSRITGRNVSNIDGLIRANGNANLFLLNPNGIIFGANARLDLGGSFIGTTAQGIKFSDYTFSTIEPAQSPLLTVSIPTGIQMGNAPGIIQVQGNGYVATDLRTREAASSQLSLRSGNTLALIGGQIQLNGGVLSAPQGRISLGSGAGGIVNLQPAAIGWAFDYGRLQTFQDIQLSHQSLLKVAGDGGGSIQIQGRQLTMQHGSGAAVLNTGTQAPIGDIQVSMTDSVRLIGRSTDEIFGSGFGSTSLSSGNGNDIRIVAGRLRLRNGGSILAEVPLVESTGVGGNIAIQSTDDIQMLGSSPQSLFPNEIIAVTRGDAMSGNVNITTRRFTVRDGGGVGSLSQGTGNAGNLLLNASESVQVIGVAPDRLQPSGITSAALGQGNAGRVTLNTRRLMVRDGGRVDSSTLASGNSGRVIINASESIIVRGRVQGSRNPSLIISSANIVDRPLQLLLNLPAVPTGAAGSVTLNTGLLTVLDGGSVTVRNDGIGDAGQLNINANSIALNDGDITATTQTGRGGDMRLTARDDISLFNRSQLSVSAESEQGAGNLEVNAALIALDNHARLEAESTGGNRSNITVNAQVLSLQRRSQITTNATGNASGGNINLNADVLVGAGNSDIVAQAEQGTGGNIAIDSQALIGLEPRSVLTPGNDINASSRLGFNGNINIENPNINPNAGLIELPEDVVDPSQQISQVCNSTQDSQFIVTGRGGIPENPVQSSSIHFPWADLRDLSMTQDSQSEVQTLVRSATLVEATRWQINAQGQTELVAVEPIASNQFQSASCQRSL